MSLDLEPKASTEGAPESRSIEETLAMISHASFCAVPQPPVGVDRQDLVQSIALAAIRERGDVRAATYNFAVNRAIDTAKSAANHNMPGNTVYAQATRALHSGTDLITTTGLLGRAAQRRAIDRFNGVCEVRPKEGMDEYGVSLEDPSAPVFEAVEERADGLLEDLIERCPITSRSINLERNRAIVILHLEGFNFSEIEQISGTNYKTANTVWREFFLQARYFLTEVMGLTEDDLRGNV